MYGEGNRGRGGQFQEVGEGGGGSLLRTYELTKEFGKKSSG